MIYFRSIIVDMKLPISKLLMKYDRLHAAPRMHKSNKSFHTSPDEINKVKGGTDQNQTSNENPSSSSHLLHLYIESILIILLFDNSILYACYNCCTNKALYYSINIVILFVICSVITFVVTCCIDHLINICYYILF